MTPQDERPDLDRLRALDSTGLLSDPPPAEFAAICQTARERFAVAMAMVTLVGEDRLIVKAGGREVMVPFVSAIVPEVDIDAGTLTVTPPPGLFEELPEEPTDSADAPAESAEGDAEASDDSAQGDAAASDDDSADRAE